MKNLAKVVPRSDPRDTSEAGPRPRRVPPLSVSWTSLPARLWSRDYVLPYLPACGPGTMSGSLGERIAFSIRFGHDFGLFLLLSR